MCGAPYLKIVQNLKMVTAERYQAQGPPRQEPADTFSLPLISSGAIPPLNYERKETTQWAKGTRSEEVQGSCGGAFASWVCGMFV